MHPLAKWLRLAMLDPWYVLKGYPNGAKSSPRAISRANNYLSAANVLPVIIEGNAAELPPNPVDLAFLHRKILERRPRCVLEFGCGFSTLVIASALSINARSTGLVGKVYSVDSSSGWIKNTMAKLPSDLLPFVEISHSDTIITTHLGQLCSVYERLPDVVPDFIYLDGPDPAAVKGNIRGLSFQNPGRTVMSADVILLESTLLPGFYMIVDGRTNNARFLSRHLTRRYLRRWRRTTDVTTFELLENKLGYKNVFGYE